MPERENSISDSEGRSVTPDLADVGIDAFSPTFHSPPAHAPHFAPQPVHSPHGENPLQRITSGLRSRKSLHSQKSRAPSQWQHLAPKEKFKAAVRKVMAMRRGTFLLGTGSGKVIGGEPGIDPSRPESDLAYGHIHQECQIEIVDYSSIRHSSKRLTNDEFVDMMDDDDTWRAPSWGKVRWIRIGGLSWDVIKALSYRHKLHPLALEDVFHGHAGNRSKADYYTKHLFLRVLCHELSGELQDNDPVLPNLGRRGMPRSHSPEPMGNDFDTNGTMDKMREEDLEAGSMPVKSPRKTNVRRRPILPFHADLPDRHNTAQSSLTRLLRAEGQKEHETRKKEAADAFLEKLKESGQRVHVKITPMFMFLFREGVVITINQAPNLEFSAPIATRLTQRDTVLRKSIDPSLLIHALLDIAVDKALQVIDEYHSKIAKFERKVLLKTNMKTVKALHILDGDLILLRRTLDPIKTMIFALRRYDLDRCAALIDPSDPESKNKPVIGFMSHKGKIYLADVYDHMDYILTSLDMFSSIAENLIDYTFNVASYEMNEVMRRLTLVTMICLPLTLLTGYFGMNFESFAAIKHSDLFFWELALPIMAVLIPLFLWSDIVRMGHYISKRWQAHKIKRV